MLPASKKYGRWAAYGLVLLAFAMRLRPWLTLEFHRDEFYSMLAMKMILEKGLPVLPSGMFYEHGLLFSYLSAGFAAIAGGLTPEAARWLSVPAGTLAVVSVLAIGRRWFGSAWVGLLAGLALAIEPESVLWSGRARMLVLAQMAVPWVVFGLWWSLRPRRSWRHRLAVIGGYFGLLLSHLSAIVLLPGLAAGWLAVRAADPNPRVRQALRNYLPWREALAVAAVAGLAVGLGAVGQLPSATRGVEAALPGWLSVLMPGGGFFGNPLAGNPLPFWRYWLQWPTGLFAAAGLLGIVPFLRNKNRRPADGAWLYLWAVTLGMALVWGLLVDIQWQRGRYLVAVAFPLLYWLGAWGVVSAADSLPRRWAIGAKWLAVAGLAALFWPSVASLAAPIGPGHMRYDLAAAFVRDQWQDGDRVMSEHPAATYLYLDRNDAYLAPDRDLILTLPDGRSVDRYTGGELVATAADWAAQFAGPGRLWLIGGENRLMRVLPPAMWQQMLWQMDKRYFSYGVWALTGRADAWPLAESMAVARPARFEDGTELHGYTVQQANRQTVRLTLFWRPSPGAGAWKIFAHLRNADNQSVAQSDHWLYHQALSEAQWRDALAAADQFRDGVQLFLPADLPDGDYRLLIGFYNPDDWARLGVENDQTGEAAVQVLTLSVREGQVSVK